MTMVASGGSLTRAPRPSSLADVLDLILDKGLVIDAYVRVSAVGIELLTIDARIVIASVDTYLHYAEAVNRLDLSNNEAQGIPGLVGRDNDGNEAGSGRSGQRGDPALGKGGQEAEGGNDENQDGEKKRGLAGRLHDRGRWS